MTIADTRSFTIEKFDFGDLPMSRLFSDFIRNADEVSSFFNGGHTYENLRNTVASYVSKKNRLEAARVIAECNKPYPGGRNTEELAALLTREDTVTITTGQQLTLFGGPLYTIFKTITAIQLARSLCRDTGKNVVPVFWLADEDHDVEEVSAVSVPEGLGIRQIRHTYESGARHAAGRIRVDDTFEKFRNDFYMALQPSDFRSQIISLLDEAYKPGRSFRDAFALLLSKLFSHHGLVFAGSNSAEVKKYAAGCLRKAIENPEQIRDVLRTQSDRMASRYHQQVQVADSLLFWHDDAHGRVRLKHNNGHWHTSSGLSATSDQLLDLLEKEPERFSPNVFLRPLIQDTLLPNAAYVGGPAEIAYHGQMKPLYDLFDMEMPFVAARMSATLAEPAVERFLTELPFGFADYHSRFEDLEQHYLRSHGNPELDGLFDEWVHRVDELTVKMADQMGMEDPGLRKHARAITRDHIKSIEKLKKKMVNAIRQREEVQINRIRKVKHSLFPNDRLQEREVAFLYFMNKFGMDIWDRLLEQLDDEGIKLFEHHYFIHFQRFR